MKGRTPKPSGKGEQFTPATAPRVGEPKPEVPSTAGGELASAPTAQPPATSQGASVYVAGKGKYRRETAVRGFDVRFTPKSRHDFSSSRCPLWATSRLMHCSKRRQEGPLMLPPVRGPL